MIPKKEKQQYMAKLKKVIHPELIDALAENVFTLFEPDGKEGYVIDSATKSLQEYFLKLTKVDSLKSLAIEIMSSKYDENTKHKILYTLAYFHPVGVELFKIVYDVNKVGKPMRDKLNEMVEIHTMLADRGNFKY